MELFLESAWATIAETEREQRKFDANLLTAARQGNKSFIIKGRGSSVVEQPIRNRQVASSTLALGSKLYENKRVSEASEPGSCLVPSKFHCSFEVGPWRSLCLWLQRCRIG